jgi:hypothetical protein
LKVHHAEPASGSGPPRASSVGISPSRYTGRKTPVHGVANEIHTGHGLRRSAGSGATMLAVVVPIGSLCMHSV